MDHEDGALLLIIALNPLIWPRRSFLKMTQIYKTVVKKLFFLRISENMHLLIFDLILIFDWFQNAP